jgi:hypothetical protein
MSYKLHRVNSAGKQTTVIRTNADGTKTYIPFDPANTDYQEYLEWAKSNTVAAADPGPSDWAKARAKRNGLLNASDWTMTTGATVDQAQWSAYREKLRDIPQTYKDKATSEIVWPTAPSTKGPNTK